MQADHTRKAIGWTLSAVVLGATAWLVWSGTWFLGAAWPDRGVLISVPFHGSATWNAGTLNVAAGSARMITYGGWWMLGLGGPLVLLVVLALLGCRHLSCRG